MKVFITLLLLFPSVLCVEAQDSKEASTLKDHFYLSKGNQKYNLVLANFTNMYPTPFVGLSYKRSKLDSDIGIALLSGYSAGLEYGKFDGSDCMNVHAETSIALFPFTLVFKLGLGANVLSDFNRQYTFSAAPLIGLDLGTAEVTYSRNISVSNSFEQNVSKHSLRVKIGIWTSYKPAY